VRVKGMAERTSEDVGVWKPWKRMICGEEDGKDLRYVRRVASAWRTGSEPRWRGDLIARS